MKIPIWDDLTDYGKAKTVFFLYLLAIAIFVAWIIASSCEVI